MKANSLPSVVTLSVTALLLCGCASPVGPDYGADGLQITPEAPPATIAAEGEVLGQGTVLQIDGEPVKLCLGAVMESYPPQCSGPEVVGWDWASVDGAEASSGVTWGTYAVQGNWDGERMTVTEPAIMLALYDPMMVPDPLRDPAHAGSTSATELRGIHIDLHKTGAFPVVASVTENGYLFVTVNYDDGQLQAYVDELYGPDTLVVESALRPVGR